MNDQKLNSKVPGYAKPELVIYGDMAKLTASGTASGKEGPGVGNTVRKL